jgi:predicted CXXCH cytochrome family protein
MVSLPGDGPTAIAPTFIGGAACAGCHETQVQQWRQSHHARSMQPARDDTVLGDFEGRRFGYSDKFVEFFRRDGGYWVRTNDHAGALEAPALIPESTPESTSNSIVEYEIEYTFGFDPLQQYLVELEGGRIQALNVAWDARDAAAGGQRWFGLAADGRLLPDDPLHWTGELLTWNGRCASCHSTNLEKRYMASTETFDTTFSSVNVDCEACHGPGSGHAADPTVALRLGTNVRATWTFGDGPIAQADRVDAQRDVELETCAACHSRRAQHADVRPGVSFFDALELSLLVEPLYFADGQILDEVFVYGSFLQSAMHGAGVTCTDCHDAHSGRLRSSGDALCAGCHRADVFAAAEHHRHQGVVEMPQCVDCHMPSRTYMQVDPRHDHSFRVPRPDLSVAVGVPNACSQCHENETAAWAAERVAEWFPGGHSTLPHYGQDLAAGRSWAADRSLRLTRLVRDATAPAIVRATGLELLSRQLDGAALDAVASVLAGEAEPLLQLAAVNALAAAEPALRRRLGQRFLDDPRLSLRLAAANVLADVRGGLSAGRQRDLDGVLAEYERVLEYNAETAEARHGLGLAHERRGDVARAEQLYRAAIAGNAYYAPAYVNLADLYRSTNREARANELLDAASRSELSDSAPVHLALGLSYVRLGATDAALASLARAAELAPDDPYINYVYALGRDAGGDRDASLQALRAAHDRFPGYAPIIVALATMYRDAGDYPIALEFAEELLRVAPGDADGLALREELRAAPR